MVRAVLRKGSFKFVLQLIKILTISSRVNLMNVTLDTNT